MNENKININWYPGHMVKTKKEIEKILSLIDVVIEIIDARIPISSKNNDFDTLIKNKPRILVFSKIDLCDMSKTLEIKKDYEQKGYKVVLLDLMSNKNMDDLLSLIDKESIVLNENRKKKGLKERRIRALVVGVPNVGKSTLINRLVGKKATNVGNKPGITKKLEWIRINKNIELLDTPGILVPRFDNEQTALNLAALSSIKEEILDIEQIAIYVLKQMLTLYPDNLKVRYDLTLEEDIETILNKIGKKIGAISNNDIDYDKVYLRILKDLQDGYLGKVTFDSIKKES